jgi:hypothetical protein
MAGPAAGLILPTPLDDQTKTQVRDVIQKVSDEVEGDFF